MLYIKCPTVFVRSIMYFNFSEKVFFFLGLPQRKGILQQLPYLWLVLSLFPLKYKGIHEKGSRDVDSAVCVQRDSQIDIVHIQCSKQLRELRLPNPFREFHSKQYKTRMEKLRMGYVAIVKCVRAFSDKPVSQDDQTYTLLFYSKL